MGLCQAQDFLSGEAIRNQVRDEFASQSAQDGLSLTDPISHTHPDWDAIQIIMLNGNGPIRELPGNLLSLDIEVQSAYTANSTRLTNTVQFLRSNISGEIKTSQVVRKAAYTHQRIMAFLHHADGLMNDLVA
jgi:hypothetical protein